MATPLPTEQPSSTGRSNRTSVLLTAAPMSPRRCTPATGRPYGKMTPRPRNQTARRKPRWAAGKSASVMPGYYLWCIASFGFQLPSRSFSPSTQFCCLYWSPGGNILLGLSIACVVLGGITNTFYLVSMFAVFTTRFPKYRGAIIAFLEFLWGSGNMVGSAIGGALIDAWAYPLPFFVLGAVTMLSFPVIAKFSSKLNQYSEDDESDEVQEKCSQNRSYYWLLIDPVFLIDMVTLMMSWIILGFNEPTLEPSLEDFNLTGTILGSVYTVQFASYSLGGFIAGAFSHYKLEAFYAMVGQLFTIVAYLVIGPAPFLPVSRTLALVYISQVFTGLGMSAQFVCGYCHGLRRAVQRGYPDNLRTNGFLSSTVLTFAVFGAMVTPPVAGYVVELYGYRKGTMLMFGILVIWAPATVALWLHSVFGAKEAIATSKSSSGPLNQAGTSRI
ncbi:MFS-type transporter SLC18B1-like isoform X3 [Dermacentor andersoni]|uniref:MFS-type transporter SLC18B1-like isoform X3 n=1 Tax=Dermacentor andersoni TaxID=34620 RepID=UPI003B3B9A35